jgi:glutamate-1-semialdehyde 2,1-aminomutase
MFCSYFTDTEIVDYKTAKQADAEKFSRFFAAMLSRGIYMAPSQFEAGFLSLAHTEKDIEKTVRAAYESLKEIQ